MQGFLPSLGAPRHFGAGGGQRGLGPRGMGVTWVLPVPAGAGPPMVPPWRQGHPEPVRLLVGQAGTVLSLAAPGRLQRNLAARPGYKSWVSAVARVGLKPPHGHGLQSVTSPCGACTNTLGLLGVPGPSSGLGRAAKPGNGISYEHPCRAHSAAQRRGPSPTRACFCAGAGGGYTWARLSFLQHYFLIFY